MCGERQNRHEHDAKAVAKIVYIWTETSQRVVVTRWPVAKTHLGCAAKEKKNEILRSGSGMLNRVER